MDKIQLHKDICLELNEMYRKKNADYGDSVGELFGKLGDISLLTRISDKYNRLMTLLDQNNNNEPNFESITDTISDMANYCIIWLLERELRASATMNAYNETLGKDSDGDGDAKITWGDNIITGVISTGTVHDLKTKEMLEIEKLQDKFEEFRATMNDNIKVIEDNFSNTDSNFKEIYRILNDVRGLNNWNDKVIDVNINKEEEK